MQNLILSLANKMEHMLTAEKIIAKYLLNRRATSASQTGANNLRQTARPQGQ
jgi:hypothetical protein